MSIEKLRNCEEMMNKKADFLEKKVEEELKKAKSFSQQQNKRGESTKHFDIQGICNLFTSLF